MSSASDRSGVLLSSALVRLILTVALLSLAGCQQHVAQRIVAAPNHGLAPLVAQANTPWKGLLGVSHELRVPVGPPEAKLSVWVLEPTTRVRPRGTVLVLHGLFAQRLLLLDTAKHLAEAGYRAVLVDLRGHGASTGEYLTYGVVESRDLVQVLDALDREKLLAGPVGVFGISYGAATAIQFAGIDPRVKAVVAIAPFSTMREEVPHYARHMVPVAGWMISEQDYPKLIEQAAKIAKFDPDAASPLAAIQKTRAQVLLIHGDLDMVIPHEQSEELRDAAPDHSYLYTLHAHGHANAWLDPTGSVKKQTQSWFDRHLPTDQHAGR